jgi:hypothetical protein
MKFCRSYLCWLNLEVLLSGVKQGYFGINQYAETCHKLMLKLGYLEYDDTQGGGRAFFITRLIRLLYNKHCKASHINCLASKKPSFKKLPMLALQHALIPYTEKDKQGFQKL